MLTSLVFTSLYLLPYSIAFFNLDQKYGTINFRGWVPEISISPDENTPNRPILSPTADPRSVYK